LDVRSTNRNANALVISGRLDGIMTANGNADQVAARIVLQFQLPLKITKGSASRRA